MFFAFDAIKRRFVQLLNACSMMVTLSLAPEQHAGERGAVLERRNADGLNRLGQRNVFQRGAAVKCVRRDAVDRFFLAVNDDFAVILLMPSGALTTTIFPSDFT